MTIQAPWVDFDSVIVSDITSVGANILAQYTNVLILDSIIISNQTNSIIKCSLNIIRETVSLKLLESFQVEAYKSFDFLASQGITSSVFYLRPEDILFGFSDAITNNFSCAVSFRKLNQLE